MYIPINITEYQKSINKYFDAFKLSGIVIYHLSRYVFFGNYDDKMKDLIHSLSNENIIYVKIFQALSGTNGFLSEKVQEYLAKYSDNVPYEENEINYQEICDYLNNIGEKYPEYKINNISQKPIHSGTISLVYDGNINNTDVVIKCLRNNVKENMLQSIESSKIIINILNIIPSIRNLGLHHIIKENIECLLEQISMKNELKNLLEMYENTKDKEYIKVPKPYEIYSKTNDNILVMEKIKGCCIEEIDENDKEVYGLILARQSVETIMNNSVYHGDLHRGNILFIKEDNNYKIGLLDYGILGRLNEHEQITLSSFYLSLGMGMYEDVVNTLITSLSNKKLLENMENDKRTQMIDELTKITRQACESTEGFGVNQLSKINQILINNGLTLPPIFCRIELALAMNVTVSRSLETNKRNFMSYLQQVIQEKMNLDIYDV